MSDKSATAGSRASKRRPRPTSTKGVEGDAGKEGGRQPHRVRLPGFVKDEDVGLGEVVRRVTSSAGIRPCGGCERRAAALNRWLVFTR